MPSWSRIGVVAAFAAGLAIISAPVRSEDRVVNFYNWSNYMAPDVLENFTKETGIKVVYDTFDANETLETRLLAGKSDDYFFDMRKQLAKSRDRLTAGLESLGFPVLRSQGTYFLTVDLSPLGLNETDEAFCRRIVTDYKVAAIPVSAFYEKDAVTSVVRFCFAKKDATLDTALERLSDAVHRR